MHLQLGMAFVALALAAAPEGANLAIVGGTLIDGHGGPPLHGATVLVEGRRILAVGPSAVVKPPPGAEIVDASGMTILPGLIDVHVHLDILGHADYRHWHESYRGRYPEIMAVAARQLVGNGVTTVADLCGDPDALRTTIERIESGDIPGPRVRASMGWIMNWPDDELARHHRRRQLSNVRDPEEARQAARRAIEQGATILKVHTGLSREQLEAISEEARRRGLKVTGHVGDREDLLMRLDAGQNGIEHLYLGGPAETSSIPPEVIQKILDRGAYVIPTNVQTMIQERAVLWPGWKDNPRARASTPGELWSDIRASIDNPERFGYFGGGLRTVRMSVVGSRIRQLWEAGVKLLIGTDAGTPLNFHSDATWQEMDLMAGYGVPPMEVLVMATRHNADYLGMGAEVGTVTPGKLADLIVVDGNPLLSMRDLRNVAVVVKDGKVEKRAR